MHIVSVFINAGVVSASVINKETLKIENTLILNLPFESNSFYINNTITNIDNLFTNIKEKFKDKYEIEKLIVTTDNKNLSYPAEYQIETESKILDYIAFYIDPYNQDNKYNLGPNNNDVANYIYYKQAFPVKLSGLYHASLINTLNNKFYSKQIISTYADVNEKFLQKFLENYLSHLSKSKNKELKIIFDPMYELVSYMSFLLLTENKITYELLKNVQSLVTVNIKLSSTGDQNNSLLLLDDSTKQEYNFIYNI